MDLSKLSESDLQALSSGDMRKLSDEGLSILSGAQPAQEPPPGPPMSRVEKFATGAGDMIHGGAQLLTQMLPESVVKAGDRANNWLADKTGLVARLPEGGVDQQVREREIDYQSRRAAAGESGIDGWRLAGNVLPSLALPAVAAKALPARIAIGAAAGAGVNALSPVTSGDFAEEKRGQIKTGAAFGAAFPLVGAGLSRVISPKASVNPNVAALRKEGITPTAGQILGGAAARTEEKLTSLPLVGDSIRGAQTRALEDMNRAVANRALSPIGGKLPAGVAGREAVEFVEKQLSDKYDDLLPRLTVKADKQFAQEIGNLSKMVRNGSMDPKYAKTFDRYMQSNVLNKFKGQNTLTGQTAKEVESDLTQTIARYARSQDPDAQLYADALREVQANLRGLISRSNPQAGDQLKAVNTGYANFKRLQRAASSVGSDEGVFTAAQLQSAVKALDRSKDKAGFARGSALMQDLSDPARAVLGSKVPNSGTADRGLLAVAGLLDPRQAAMALSAPVLYSQPGQRALAALLASRPQAAQPVADALRKASPGLGLLGGQFGLQTGFQ